VADRLCGLWNPAPLLSLIDGDGDRAVEGSSSSGSAVKKSLE
jgi:hypothetical protein